MLAACALTLGGCMGNFDPARWAQGSGNYDGANVRLDMVSSARAAGARIGSSRASIQALLGKPDSRGPDADIWYLGRSSLSVDFRQLRIRYDADGKALSVDEITG